MIIYNGIIEKSNFETDISFVGHVLSIEEILYLMKSLSPDFVEVNDNIYLLSNYKSCGTENNRFDNSKQGKEKYINTISISDVFYFSEDQQSHNRSVQIDIGNFILQFWKMRLLYLFPNKEFEFILSENNLFDESGVCITFCQTIK